MNLKRIDLFQLMNDFQDEEFEPEEECFVDRNKVKETVLAQVRQKKRKGRTVLVLAAALPGGAVENRFINFSLEDGCPSVVQTMALR